MEDPNTPSGDTPSGDTIPTNMNPTVAEFVPFTIPRYQPTTSGAARQQRSRNRHRHRREKKTQEDELAPVQQTHQFVPQQPNFAFQQPVQSNSHPVQDFGQNQGYLTSGNIVQSDMNAPGYGIIQNPTIMANAGPANTVPHALGYGPIHTLMYTEGNGRVATQFHRDDCNFASVGSAQASLMAQFQEKVETEMEEENMGRFDATNELVNRVEIVRASGTDGVNPELNPLAQMLFEEVRLQVGSVMTPHEEGYLERVQEMAKMTEIQLMVTLGLPITQDRGVTPAPKTVKEQDNIEEE
jgi:hypothetical protein